MNSDRELDLPEGITIGPEGRDWLLRLIEVCDDTRSTLYAWGQAANWLDVVEGTPRHHDIAAVSRKLGPDGVWTARPIERALHTSIIHMGAALQHLAGVRSLLLTGQVIFPVAPIVRSIVETCGRVIWTMAPMAPIGVRERVARMFLIEIDDVRHAKSLAKTLGAEREVTRWGDAMHEVRKVRLPGFFDRSEIDHDERGNLVVAGQVLPRLSGFVRELGTPGLYESLSAATHPTLFLTTEVIDRSSVVTGDAEPAKSVPLTFRLLSMSSVATLTRNAALSIVQAWIVLAAYQGIAHEALDDLQDRIDRVSAAPEAAHRTS